MSEQPSRQKLFQLMGLGPVWELREGQSVEDETRANSEHLPKMTSQVESLPVAVNLTEPPLEKVPTQDTLRAAADIQPTCTKIGNLADLRQLVSSCTRCALAETRKQTVFSAGVERSPVMVIGEAPGADEDSRGEPFVGRAGQLLERMLESIDLSRKKNIYIANVLKCRPPDNRNPRKDEVAACKNYLLQQIQLNKPKALFLVGNFSIQTLLGTSEGVGKLRGRVHQVNFGDWEIPAVVTYHPAHLLRSPSSKKDSWEDLLMLKKLLD